MPVPFAESAPAGPSDLSRFGIKGASQEAEIGRAEQARVMQEQLRLIKEREDRELAERRKEEQRRWEEMKVVYEATKVIATHEADGFVVQVEGLVWGTSAEDVQVSAFIDLGWRLQ